MKQFYISLLIICSISQVGAQQRVSKVEYDKAYALAENAIQEFKSDNIVKADSLINASIQLYPTMPVYNYAFLVGQTSNIVGADLLLKRVIEKVKSSEGYDKDPLGTFAFRAKSNFRKTIKIPYNKEKHIYNLLSQSYYIFNALGDKQRALYWMQQIDALNIRPANDPKVYEVEIEDQYLNKIRIQVLLGNYGAAIQLAQDKELTEFYTTAIKYNAIETILLSNYYGTHDKTYHNEVVSILNKPGKEYAYFAYLATVSDAGDALKIYNRLTPQEKNHIYTQYYLALVETNLNQNKKAVERLLKVLEHSKNIPMEEIREQVNQRVTPFYIYNALGNAYRGQQMYARAENYYKMALLLDPEFLPAKMGLESLNNLRTDAQLIDKTPPTISIQQPTLDNGTIWNTKEQSIIIRGTAEDLSGVKHVKINDVEAYLNNFGHFWTEVNLSVGTNKLLLVSEDINGNRNERVLTVVRNEDDPKGSIAIVPIEEKKGNNYCLLVAVQDYLDEGIINLNRPIADAVKLKVLLRNGYNFLPDNIITLLNPEVKDFQKQLLDLEGLLRPEDNLLIFFAGHGLWSEEQKTGYWLFSNSEMAKKDTWLTNKEVLESISKLSAKQILLISDACFSGSVFRTRSASTSSPQHIKDLTSKITRVAITSGNTTEVPDESIFMKHLITALTNNKDNYMTSQKLFINHILESVISETGTEPRYGTLELAGHIGGDFVFEKKLISKTITQ